MSGQTSDCLEETDSAWAEGDYLLLPGFLYELDYARLAKEAESAYQLSTRRDFRVAETGNSPRRMSNLGATAVERLCPGIWSAYRSSELLSAVFRFSGVQPVPLEGDIEAVVVNYLHEMGDTHGAHFDDHEVAFVMVLEAPEVAKGGQVALHRGDSIETFDVRAGDAYILRAGMVRHSVTPVTEGRRVAVVCAYDLAGREQPRSSGTAALLYS